MLPWLTSFKLTSFALGAQTLASSLPLHAQAQRASVQESGVPVCRGPGCFLLGIPSVSAGRVHPSRSAAL